MCLHGTLILLNGLNIRTRNQDVFTGCPKTSLNVFAKNVHHFGIMWTCILSGLDLLGFSLPW